MLHQSLIILLLYSSSLIKLSACTINNINSDISENLQYRLPNNTIPLSYHIEVTTQIDRNDFKFSGIVTIKISVIKENTNSICLHYKNATLTDIKINNLNKNVKVDIIDQKYNDKTEILELILNEELDAEDTYELKITYNSVLREDNLGFYRSSYLDDSGKKVWLAATQFAPTQARHAFPCYDEPKFKSTFSIVITHPKNLEALSNMDIQSSLNNSDDVTRTTVFQKTPTMSTYLVGFVISDFKKQTSNQINQFQHETYVRYNALKYINFASEFGGLAYQKLLDHFSGASQPIDTMKQIALPDFHFSGMENWGMVTYKETVLLYDKKIHGAKKLLNLAYVMGHEMAHQWFGNLVTPEWWSYVWLKEGFATMYGHYVIDMLYPKWKQMQYYQIDVMHRVFQIDETTSIRPMTFYVETQTDIRNNYDKIAYEKSSCVLRMFDHAFGKDQMIFKKGVDTYLSKNKMGTATEKDLFNALAESFQNIDDNLPIGDIMGLWTSQAGHPLLHVTTNDLTKDIHLKQERFFNTDTTDKSLWHIPVNYEIENGTNFKNTTAQFWMTDKVEVFQIPEELNWSPSRNWIIFNVQQTGYYRVNYDLSNWKLLTKALMSDHTKIHIHNRAQLIDDAFNLALVNKLEYSVLLDLVKYMKNERDYAPWAAFANGIKFLTLKLTSDVPNLTEMFKKFMASILVPAFKYFGVIIVSNEPPLMTLTRQLVAKQTCSFQMPECIENKLNYSFTDMRLIYYSTKLRNKESGLLNKVKDLIKNSDDIFVREDLISSLGYYEDENVLSLFLWYTIQNTDDLKFSKAEKATLIKSVYQNSQLGLQLSLDFILNSWQDLKEHLPEDGLNAVIEDIALYIHNDTHIKLFNKLLGIVMLSDKSATTVKQTIIKNIEWNLFHKPNVVKWLNQNYQLDGADKNDKNAASFDMKLGKLVSIILLIFWTLICF